MIGLQECKLTSMNNYHTHSVFPNLVDEMIYCKINMRHMYVINILLRTFPEVQHF